MRGELALGESQAWLRAGPGFGLINSLCKTGLNPAGGWKKVLIPAHQADLGLQSASLELG